MKKKILSIFISLVMTWSLFSSFFITVQATSNGTITVNSDLTIKINGQKVNFPDASPFIDSAGRTQVPIRFISEELGFKVDWRGSGVVSINNGEENLNLRAGSPQMYCTIGGVRRTIFMDTSAKIINDRTYIPLRYIAEAFGFTVEWNNSTGSGNSGLTGEEAIELVRQEINKGEVVSKDYIPLLKLKFSFVDRGSYYIVNATATAYADGTIKYLVYKLDKSLKYLGQASDWSDTEYNF